MIHQSRGWKLTLAYDGSGFCGWQVQPGQPTVQGELAQAILRVTGERVLPQGSGRTDAGVHALGQVASFVLAAAIPAENLQRALNRKLPAAIRVLSAEIVSPTFHARHCAREKTYEYRIFRGEICPPPLARYVYALHWPLNIEAMNQAARYMLGEHDFTSFAAHDPDATSRLAGNPSQPTCVRLISQSEWSQTDALLVYRVTGSGFLHHMVRNLVGTFIDVGRGALTPEAITGILTARSRNAAGPTAPACGLFLTNVAYPTE